MKTQRDKAGLNLRKQHRIRHKDIKLGQWNVLSLYRLGSLRLLLKELDKYNIDLAAIQEIRWKGSGLLEKRYHTIYYSCQEQCQRHSFGTGFVVRGRTRDLVIGFTPMNPRICILRLKGKFYNYSIVSCHAPTEVTPEDEKEVFYDTLDRVFDSCPKSDIKIIAGDFNAKIGKELAFIPTIGRYSLHDETNDNGRMLINFAASKDMVVGSTMFPGKRIHKGTWRSPDGNTVNQIDHVLISRRHRSNLISTRSYRGANVDTDHYLVVSRIRARISNARKLPTKVPKRVATLKLKDPETSMAYQIKLGELLTNEGPGVSVQEQWNKCSTAVRRAAEDTLGLEQKATRSCWFDDECAIATDAKNKAYSNMVQKRHTRLASEEYRDKRRQEKRLHRQKKREWEHCNLAEVRNVIVVEPPGCLE